jgi:hypothetical protein
MNKFEDRSPSVGDVVNVCKENIIKDGDREHNKHYRRSPRAGHNVASNMETFYHPSLIPTTTKTTLKKSACGLPLAKVSTYYSCYYQNPHQGHPSV